MKKIAIHQPNYIPWLGYFYKVAKCDVFVFLDDAQFSNAGAHNYHYIKTPQGALRLKIPVIQKLGYKINELKTRDELGWKNKHLKSVEANYKKALHFEQVYNDFKEILLRDYDNLAELNRAYVEFVCRKLDIQTQFINSSELGFSSTGEEKLLDICNALEADIYYSGTGAKAYQKEENFEKRGITLEYSDFKPITYKQLWGDFITNVSIIDYLMHFGYDFKPALGEAKAMKELIMKE